MSINAINEVPTSAGGGHPISGAKLTHRSEPDSLRRAPRCQAHARTMGQPCRAPAVKGKRVCRMHGGSRGSGAPSGKANGSFKHGGWTAEAVAARREAAAILKAVREAANV